VSKLTADDVVHAWKDEQFRSSLSEEVQSALPAAPENAGAMSDEELKQAAGGFMLLPPVDGPWDRLDIDLT